MKSTSSQGCSFAESVNASYLTVIVKPEYGGEASMCAIRPPDRGSWLCGNMHTSSNREADAVSELRDDRMS
jgi:hypothetical protein